MVLKNTIPFPSLTFDPSAAAAVFSRRMLMFVHVLPQLNALSRVLEFKPVSAQRPCGRPPPPGGHQRRNAVPGILPERCCCR